MENSTSCVCINQSVTEPCPPISKMCWPGLNHRIRKASSCGDGQGVPGTFICLDNPHHTIVRKIAQIFKGATQEFFSTAESSRLFLKSAGSWHTYFWC